MLPKEILAQVRRLEITASRLVSETFAGEYLSVFKGRGMEFESVREYAPGDDVRSIDWSVTARSGRLHVRQYCEERELTVVVACDLSGSQYFGTAGRLKKEVAAEIAAVIAFCALQNNDKAGLFLFTQETEKFVAPRKGRRHALHLIREVLAFEPTQRGTNLAGALSTLARVLKRRGVIFLLSDFREEGPAPAFEKALKLCALKHDLVPLLLTDRREEALPPLAAVLELEDPETGRRALLDGRSRDAVSAHARRERERVERLEGLFRQCGLDWARLEAGRPYIDPLARFFERRARRLRR